MRNVLLAATVLLATACGAYHFPGASPAATGTVTGTVSAMPCGPIKPMPPVDSGPSRPPQDSAPCRMSPAVGVEIAFASGETVRSALTDSAGRYRIELAEGTYKVSVRKYTRIISGPQEVTVKAASTVTADYLVDSGIRILPVPQQ
ncbi:MAG: hypothetical protein NVS9B11_17350 [Candidatus Dormibacteraceae bacterium]